MVEIGNTVSTSYPSVCPKKNSDPCQIIKKGVRIRKCGPALPLKLYLCKVHGKYFTVYPLGWVPFGRKPWFIINENGEFKADLKKTYFSCLIDMMTKSNESNSYTYRSNCRHVNSIIILLGLDCEDTTSVHNIAETIKIDALILLDLREAISEGPLITKALEIQKVLQHFDLHLLQRGSKLNFWGTPINST